MACQGASRELAHAAFGFHSRRGHRAGRQKSLELARGSGRLWRVNTPLNGLVFAEGNAGSAWLDLEAATESTCSKHRSLPSP